MRKHILRELVLTLSLVLVVTGAALGAATYIEASSHREAPLISKDPTVDNTDVYAFMSPDAPAMTTLIANWIPFEEPAGGPNFYHFDDLARYYIKIDRDGDGVEDISYLWTFHTAIQNPNTFLYNTGPLAADVCTAPTASFNYRQYYTVTEVLGPTNTPTGRTVLGSNLLMPPDNIGPRSTPNYAGIRAGCVKTLSGNGVTYKEYTGQRADPFFVDIGSIFDLGGLRPFNAAHVIPLSPTVGMNNLDDFSIHTTSIQAPKSRLLGDGRCVSNVVTDTTCVLGIWSTAERPVITTRGTGTEVGSGGYQQVSRLGNPLVNEVVIPLALKDAFNAIPPTVDKTVPQAVASVNDPELARLICYLYGVDSPGLTPCAGKGNPAAFTQPRTAPRSDLFVVFLTGVPGLNRQQNSGQQPSEQLRLNVAIAPTAGICAGNPLGVTGGDFAGWPNGRRIEDDVTDIEIRAVAGSYGAAQGVVTSIYTPAIGFNKAPNNALGDGVNTTQKPCLASFPYMADPTSGYDSPHATPQSLTPPVVPELTPFLMFGTGLAGLGGYAVMRARAARAARRKQQTEVS